MDLKDAFTFSGISLVGIGMFMVKPAYAFVVVGTIVLVLGVWPKR